MFNTLKWFTRLLPTRNPCRWKNANASIWRNGSNYSVLQNTSSLHPSILKFPISKDNTESCKSIFHPVLNRQLRILDVICPLGIHPSIYVPSGIPLLEKIEEFIPTEGEKKAARLIVIRRRKMKKHKLRKLRKRMKFEWAKVYNRRKARKEKAFQTELISHIQAAERFDAAEYVSLKLQKLHKYTSSTSDKSYTKNS